MAEGESRTGLVALPVAVLLLALLTVWVVVFSREDGAVEGDGLVASTSAATSEPAELAELWRSPAVAAAIDDAGARATRLWAHDGTVTLVSTAGVRGFGTVDGAPLWEAAAPPGAGAPCAAAEGTNAAGIGAVLYLVEDGQADTGCSVLGMVDTTSGELLWWQRFARPVAAADVTVSVGEQAVTVGLDDTGELAGFRRYAVSDGAELGLPPQPEDGSWACADGRETLAVRHAGSRLAVLTRCASTPELTVYHADTGELEWTHPASDPEFGFSGILAGDPVLLLQGNEAVAYAETGEELWRLPLDGLRTEMSAVAGGVLCVRSGSAGLAGYDVADGDRLWETELPEGAQLFGVDDEERLLLGHPADSEWLRLTRLDPADGSLDPAGSIPLDGRRVHDGQFVAWDEHQLYVMAPIRRDGTDGLRLRAFER
ncbi:outer membrane protein assembly factor BamB family protein [Streptomyces litchfieldiae]|uniref:PQQ-binding-like beta-propeller repeat protein n=1 Tax=Streptomyces litchfieldiae TaxID=3075543 RepID=A0ABU2N167_9ACTN|nr:PQQ-binding-like beta-propeller repeat protein [Streptomyces sp. DSM 44938]MDT0347657.1 PQQ-binding-like beta-propeller repeat protein [Streptomyces sp. DSM 44938]